MRQELAAEILPTMRTTTRSNSSKQELQCIQLRVRDHKLPLLSTAITEFPNIAFFAQTYVTQQQCTSTISKRCENTATTPVFFINFQAQMTKGMTARAGFYSEFLGSEHKGNGGIRRGRGPCRPLNGRQAPVARGGGGDRPPFFSPGTSLQIWREKKLYFGPVALWEGDRGIFLKFSKTDIYF